MIKRAGTLSKAKINVPMRTQKLDVSYGTSKKNARRRPDYDPSDERGTPFATVRGVKSVVGP